MSVRCIAQVERQHDVPHTEGEMRMKSQADNPGDFAWFPFPAEFCGLNELIKRLGDETTRLPMASFDTSVIDELRILQDGLSQLRFDRWKRSEQDVNLFLDLLRGIKTQETRTDNAED